MKSIINNFLRRFLKIEIKKFHPRLGIFTNLHLKTIKRSPVIFDIGANEGQSIERYLKTFDSPLIIERCHNVDVINEWKSLFTCFMDEERFYSLFSPLRLPTGEEEEESFEALTNSSSRWFYTVE